MTLPIIKLRKERASAHPWIFNKMVRHPQPKLPAGSLVEVQSQSGVFVGRGIYHPSQTICLRLLTEDPLETLDEAFFHRRLAKAKAFREDILHLPETTDSYRLIHAESDNLSGLVIDKFADVLVVQPNSAGYLKIAPWIVAALQDLYAGCRIAFRPDSRSEAKEGVSFAKLAALYPGPKSVTVREHGIRMCVNLATGHKTGYFLDQRENRAFVAELARGRKILDLFCYTGGFAISAKKGGATSSTAVDLDEKALEVAQENADLNQVEIAFHHVDAFDFLRSWIKDGRTADMVVADPAKLANVKDEVSRALKTYGDLNRLAIQVIAPGGILVTCSCSGLVEPEIFLSVVRRSAREAGKVLQIFRMAGAAADHPVSSDFPEGRYLTAIFARVWPTGRCWPVEENRDIRIQ